MTSSLQVPLARGSVLAWEGLKPRQRRRGLRGEEGECDLSRGRGRGGGRKRRRRRMREVEGSPRHRMTAGESPKGEGPVYQLPCPHSPFNKPDLMSVCLSYIDLYLYIDRYTHSFLSFHYKRTFRKI